MAIVSDMHTCSIKPDGIGAFLVRVTHADGGCFIIGGFRTWEAAAAWVAAARSAQSMPLNGTVVAPMIAEPQ
jgi:hypothetical protein